MSSEKSYPGEKSTTMNRPGSKASKSKTTKSNFKFRWQTIVFLSALFVSLFLLNACGSPDTYEPWDNAVGVEIFTFLGVFKNGCPLTFLRRSTVQFTPAGSFLPTAGIAISPFDLVSNVLDFSLLSLLINLFFAGFLLVSITLIFERKFSFANASRPSFGNWHFGISTILRITLILAMWFVWLRSDLESIQQAWNTNLYFRLFTFGIDPILRAITLLPVIASMMIITEHWITWLFAKVRTTK